MTGDYSLLKTVDVLHKNVYKKKRDPYYYM